MANFKIDVKKSILLWTGTNDKGSNRGELKLKEGFVKVENMDIVDGKLIFDMKTIKTTEANLSDEDRHKLDNHLKSREFFDIDHFPYIQFFVLKSGLEDGAGMLRGDLFLKKVVYKVSIPITFRIEDGKFHAVGQFNLPAISREAHEQIGENYHSETPVIDATMELEAVELEEQRGRGKPVRNLYN